MAFSTNVAVPIQPYVDKVAATEGLQNFSFLRIYVAFYMLPLYMSR